MSAANNPCYYFHFGLIVTGKGEREHLPKLFRSLMASGICNFQVIQFAGQRSSITSPKRKLKMVGQGKIIPDKDEEQIGLPARRHLNGHPCHFVILIDDLEYDRREQAQPIFDRYQKTLDAVLTDEQQHRASVHFLVYMLEAYYFAHAEALNAVLDVRPPLQDYEGDVEAIRHPKNDLKYLYPGFNEVGDGGKIVARLDIEYVLARPETCASLRTLFAWCVKVLKQYPNQEYRESLLWVDKYRLDDGILSGITKAQLDNIG